MTGAIVKRTAFLLCCCMVVLLTASFSRAQEGSNKDYVIGAEDVLDIQVWGNDDLHRSVEVSQEGDFTFPLINTVRAAGLSVFELEKLMRKRLAEGYLVDPHVTVIVSTYKSQKVFLQGEFKKAGTYIIKGRTHIVKVISEAGGLSDEASQIVTISRAKKSLQRGNPKARGGLKDEMTIVVDLDQVHEGSKDERYYVYNGDSVTAIKATPVYVSGEVGKPGAYRWEKGMTILQAISLAGGLTKEAGTNVTVTRPNASSKEGGQQPPIKDTDNMIIELDLDQLQKGSAGDTFTVLSGDSLSVSKAPPIYVNGEVNRPGEFKWEKRLTVRQAVSLAGGPTSKGSLERTQIIRTEKGQEKEIKPGLNDPVMPYDIIKVPQSYF